MLEIKSHKLQKRAAAFINVSWPLEQNLVGKQSNQEDESESRTKPGRKNFMSHHRLILLLCTKQLYSRFFGSITRALQFRGHKRCCSLDKEIRPR